MFFPDDYRDSDYHMQAPGGAYTSLTALTNATASPSTQHKAPSNRSHDALSAWL
jgi:hypothetical protein